MIEADQTLTADRAAGPNTGAWGTILDDGRAPVNILLHFSYVIYLGPRAFYESVALRRTCCHIRKVEPLRPTLCYCTYGI